MKILLIIVNLFLAGMVVREGVALLRPSGGETLELVRRERPATSKNTAQVAVPAGEGTAVDPLRTVLRHNIFDMSRLPRCDRRKAGGVGQFDFIGRRLSDRRLRRGDHSAETSEQPPRPMAQQPQQQQFKAGAAASAVFPHRRIARKRLPSGRGLSRSSGSAAERRFDGASAGERLHQSAVDRRGGGRRRSAQPANSTANAADDDVSADAHDAGIDTTEQQQPRSGAAAVRRSTGSSVNEGDLLQ